MSDHKRIEPYDGAAGGWGALVSTTRALLNSRRPLANIRNLLKVNQSKGFDCPGCAWGDAAGHSVNFCENGAKAVAWESTANQVRADFFRTNKVSALRRQSDYFLEYQGRIAEPLCYNPATDAYDTISWQDAFELIGEKVKALSSPDELLLYTSGRASNEVAYLYQLFGRFVGTNNFPDCSNMCHEASGVGLGQSIGVGKGTVTLDDFEQADAIFVFGQNPGTNHPRMLHTLSQAAKKGAAIVSINNLKERGLERFDNPQDPRHMLTRRTSSISSLYLCPRLGGDMALVRGMVKQLWAWQQQGRSVFDRDFIERHTQGLDDYLRLVEQTDWSEIESQSGLSRAQIVEAAEVFAGAKRVICTWAMGITQHRHSVATVQEIVNLQLLAGHVGRSGAGLSPVRGHSNVQGNRTVGINELPSDDFLDRLEAHFERPMPRKHGLNTVESIAAMEQGTAKAFIALGGNFAAAAPDSARTEAALANCELTVHISTKLNRSHLWPGKAGLILPCLGRTEQDLQNGVPQYITVEDSFSMVHASQGMTTPNSPEQRSEVAIVAGIAAAVLGEEQLPWTALAGNYDRIRELIGQTIPGFERMNDRLSTPGGFYLDNSAARREWQTPSGKANFIGSPLPQQRLPLEYLGRPVQTLQTLRAHDQYNTTVYGLDDRYRGVYGQRMVLFINREDMADQGLQAGQKVTLQSVWFDNRERKVEGFTLVPYDIPRGNLAAYYPETNPLVPLDSVGENTGTPTSKSVGVVLIPEQETRIL
ncbi:FdhF/YdeP family oxidoreductase [Zobellella maritima]|uniref:FdhF/YdeP family oxidoreductase n=1 Tax=Zobellella maritima TaxID=2059725 RepID=UPI000E3038E9|nr:FdhF/YdeP family oxidoreductase [Zobellella maritima]